MLYRSKTCFLILTIVAALPPPLSKMLCFSSSLFKAVMSLWWICFGILLSVLVVLAEVH